jgi:hypothetical protein
MNNQLENTFKPYHIGNGWGAFVDIENYEDDINKRKLVPIIQNSDDNEYDVLDYYNDYNDNEKNDIEEIIKKMEKDFEQKDEDIGCNFEKINKDVLNFIINLDAITFITVSVITFVGFCIP